MAATLDVMYLGAGCAPDAELVAALEAARSEGRATWPTVDLADEEFVRGLAARAAPDGPPAAAVRRLRVADVYLVLACAAGIPGSLAAFDAALGPVIRSSFARLRIAPADRDDLYQQLHEKLFVGPRARIADYAGRGELRGWVRAAATRTGLNFLDRKRREQPLTGEVLRALPSTGDPALDRLRDACRGDFEAAIREAMAALPARDRTLLAQAFVDGLNIDELGVIHGVHRATAARWLVQARASVLSATKATLQARLKLARPELESLMRLIDSQLEVSVTALMAEAV